MFGRRPDATLATDVPAYRRIMPFLMKGRNESAVYFDLPIDMTRPRELLDAFNQANPDSKATLFHLVTWAAVRTLAERPRLNRFVAGGRLWQRDGIWISYSAKKRFDDDSPIVVLKRRFDPGASFEQTVRAMHAGVKEGKSDRRSRVDKELGVLLRLPGPLLRMLLALAPLADGLGLLPRSFIDGDPMFASLFIANLGSLKMDAAYHHLYEYGNIPIFCVIGQVHDEAVVVDGKVEVRPMALLRFSYDERVEDGLYAQRALQRLRQLVEEPSSAEASG
jgi:hypothetical protein